MKKVTLILFLFSMIWVGAQPTTDPATPPTRNATDVISIFSDAYANVSGADYNPNWGQAGFTVANPAFMTPSGNAVLAYPTFNYQGIDYNGAQDISAMEFLHVDIWVDGTFNPNVFVISSGAEIAHPIMNTGSGTWISMDIPVVGITGDLTNAIQFKFDGGGAGTDGIYVDNLYFYRNPVNPAQDAKLTDLQIDNVTIPGFAAANNMYTYEVSAGTTTVPQITGVTTSNPAATSAITQATAVPGSATVLVTATDGTTTETYTVNIIAVGPPMAAPTPPNRAAADVFSIYSDAYTDVVSTFDAGWCGSGSIQEITIGSDAVQRYLGNPCQGIDFAGNRIDASGFTNMHIDFYTTETNLVGKVFNLKLVDFGNAGGTAEIGSVEINLNDASTPAITTGSWISVDVPVNLSAFTGLAQAAITSNLNGTVWYDNFYLHNNTTLSNATVNKLEVQAYPNPTTNVWNFNAANQINSVQLYDLVGKQLIQVDGVDNTAIINAAALKPGIYFARVEGINGQQTLKLIKE